MAADVLAFGTYSDDLELGVGGILIKLVRDGRRVAVVDLMGAGRQGLSVSIRESGEAV